MKKTAIVGFGYIGTCIGAVLADRGYDVTGIDARKQAVEEINAGTTSLHEPGLREMIAKNVAAGRLRATTDYAPVADADVVIVTVGTPLGNDLDPDMGQIVDASSRIARYLRRGQLVVLKSTIPPGTTEDVVRPALEKSGLRLGDFLLAFCPERLAEGRALLEFTTLPVVVGGVDERSTEAAANFWREALDVPIVKVGNARAAELTKLADNLFIDLNVALANEIAMLCDKLGVDAMEVIHAANTLPKGQHMVNILTPGAGVGGYCLTKDPWFVHHLGKRHGLELRTPVASRTINDGMPRYTVESLRHELARGRKTLQGARVAVLGIAMKSNVGDVRFTPAKDVVNLLEEAGATLAICDPAVTPADAKTVTPRELVAIEDALRGADAVVVLAGHTEFRTFPLARLAQLVKPGCVVLDGRVMYNHAQIDEMRRLGLVFRGIGR